MEKLRRKAKAALGRLLGHVPQWSATLALGQSPLMRLTILLPFVGSMILFNNELVRLLELAPIALSTSGSQGTQDSSISRLVLTYFGLVSLGVGSFIFSLRCPPDLKQSRTEAEYISEQEPLLTRPRMTLFRSEIFANYVAAVRKDGDLEVLDGRYSRAQAEFFDETVRNIAERMDLGETDHTDEPDEEGGYGPLGLFDHRGALHVNKLAILIYLQPTAMRILAVEFADQAMNFKTDILTLRYGDLNQSRPVSRLAIIVLYTVGFGLLSIPTLATFHAIVRMLI